MILTIIGEQNQQSIDVSKAGEIIVNIKDLNDIIITTNDSNKKLIFEIQIQSNGCW